MVAPARHDPLCVLEKATPKHVRVSVLDIIVPTRDPKPRPATGPVRSGKAKLPDKY